MPLLGIFLGGAASALGCFNRLSPVGELVREFGVRHVRSVDDIVSFWIIGANVEFGIVVDVEFVSGRFVVIWDIVNNVCFHFWLATAGGMFGLCLGLTHSSIFRHYTSNPQTRSTHYSVGGGLHYRVCVWIRVRASLMCRHRVSRRRSDHRRHCGNHVEEVRGQC